MNELLINTTTTGAQFQPAIAAIRNNFVIVWADSSAASIKGQFISADGNRIGSEFVVSTSTESNTNRLLPAIQNRGNGFVVVWIEKAFNPPGPHPHVHLQMFDLAGQKVGPQRQVSSTDIDPNHPLGTAFMIDGGFVVTWLDARADRRIRAQRFTSDGSPKGPEIQVNSIEAFHDKLIITNLVGGNYVIGWRNGEAIGGGRLHLRLFDLEGTPLGDDLRPNEFASNRPAITFLDNGDFVVARLESTGVDGDTGVGKSIVVLNIFGPNGLGTDEFNATSSARRINSDWPALAPLPGQRFIVTWVEKRTDNVQTSPVIKARVFRRDGSEVGEEFQVNTAMAQHRSFVCVATSVFDAFDITPTFIAWDDDSRTGGDTSDFAVRGRRLRVTDSGGISE